MPRARCNREKAKCHVAHLFTLNKRWRLETVGIHQTEFPLRDMQPCPSELLGTLWRDLPIGRWVTQCLVILAKPHQPPFGFPGWPLRVVRKLTRQYSHTHAPRCNSDLGLNVPGLGPLEMDNIRLPVGLRCWYPRFQRVHPFNWRNRNMLVIHRNSLFVPYNGWLPFQFSIPRRRPPFWAYPHSCSGFPRFGVPCPARPLNYSTTGRLRLQPGGHGLLQLFPGVRVLAESLPVTR